MHARYYTLSYHFILYMALNDASKYMKNDYERELGRIQEEVPVA
jgi:hypothetical protein